MKIESWHLAEVKRRWRIVRTDNYTDVVGEIIAAFTIESNRGPPLYAVTANGLAG